MFYYLLARTPYWSRELDCLMIVLFSPSRRLYIKLGKIGAMASGDMFEIVIL